MKTAKSIMLALVVVIFFMSCEGPKSFSVTVIDHVSKKPIDSVSVQVRVMAGKQEKSAYNVHGYTDSTGTFAMEEMIGYGLSLKRWDFYMDYEKKGYAHKSEKNRTEGIVELER